VKIEKFEDILSWQKAKELNIEIYKLFSGHSDRGFRNQIERASVSVMNNIAEGYERQTNNEFKQFLYIAKGSCGECRSMLILGYELNYIKEDEYTNLYNMSVEISKLLSGFIKTL